MMKCTMRQPPSGKRSWDDLETARSYSKATRSIFLNAKAFISLLLLFLRIQQFPLAAGYAVKLPSSMGSSAVSTSASASINENRVAEHIQAPFPNPTMIACSSAVEMQRAIGMYVRDDDRVLELGSLLSETSRLVCQTMGPQGSATLFHFASKDKPTSGRTLGQTPEQLSETFSDRQVDLVELEQLDDWRGAVSEQLRNEIEQKSKGWDVLLLDLGATTGNDLHLSSLVLANELLNCISTISGPNTADSSVSPRVVIIKSKSLSRLALRLVHAQRLIDGNTQLTDASLAKDTVNKEGRPDVQILPKSSEPPIVACVGVHQYRRTIPYVVAPSDEKEGDSILEVGCHLGRTTALLDEAGHYCLGVDIGPKIIQRAKQEYPKLNFYVANAWDTLELLRIQNRYLAKEEKKGNIKHSNTDATTSFCYGYDVVYADIGGLSGPDGYLESLALLDAVSRSLQPRCIVIKSLCMRRLSSRLQPFWRIWNSEATKGPKEETRSTSAN